MLKSAKAGYENAEYKIGNEYFDGNEYVEADIFEAKGWYEKAAEKGHRYAMIRLGDIYSKNQDLFEFSAFDEDNGLTDYEKDIQKAEKCYKSVADKDGLTAWSAMLKLAYIYAFEDYFKNEKLNEAIKLFKDLLDKNYYARARIKFLLGKLYCTRLNNVEEGKVWLKKCIDDENDIYGDAEEAQELLNSLK